jgi:hypothetical protein
MSLTSANMRQHISRCVFTFLVLCSSVLAQATGSSALFFVGATPAQPDVPKWYAAGLYTVGSERKLQLVRQMFSVDQHFQDFAEDLDNRFYLASQSGIMVLHLDDPDLEDFVSVDNFDDFPCWGAVKSDTGSSAVQYCSSKIFQVLGSNDSSQPRNGAGDWSKFKFLRYGGENGGPFPMQPPLAEIAGADVVMPYAFRPDVTIAKLPREWESPAAKRRTIVVVAATSQYLALWIVPDQMVGHTIDAANPDHAEPIQVLLWNKATDKWRTLELATTVTSLTHPPVRVFGDWLVTTTMEWRPGPAGSGSGSPGTANERAVLPIAEHPSVRDQYMNQFIDLYIPGKLILQNLSNDKKLVLNTGQEDSEILAIRSTGEVAYRVNDTIYSAKIVGDQITSAMPVVKDIDVPEIHWAFWAPAAHAAKPAANSRRSD